jgi:3-isopropylmalate dehydrogenase
MLDWLSERTGVPALAQAAQRLERAVDTVFASGKVLPFEFGGRDGTDAIATAVASNL